MRLGIFGGTFDPVHLGHLILAEQCREQGPLDQVWFVPAASPPNKLGQGVTPFERRAEMLALATAGNPAFRVEDAERDRPGPSYTADTLAEIHGRLPDAELFFLVGSDSLLDLPRWYRPEQVVALASLLVMVRPGTPTLTREELAAQLNLMADAVRGVATVEAPQIDIASRDLRARAADGRSLRYLVPHAVEAYIKDKRLYQQRT